MGDIGSSQIRFRRCCLRYTSFARALLPVLLTIMFSRGELTSQDEQTGSKPLRVDITPLIGYRTGITFPTGQDVQVQSTSGIISAKPSYGFAVGMRLNEEDLIEFRWARQASDIRFTDVGSASAKIILNQVHGDFTHEYILDTWPIWARPYVIGSVGATLVDGGKGSTFTRFSFGLGTGIKVYLNRHMGLRFQAEWLPIVLNPEVSAFVCGTGCVVHLSATAVSQGEIVAGPIFRF
jgi:hypothetical protein